MRRFSNENNPDDRHSRLACQNHQLSALLGSTPLGFRDNHETQVRSVTVNHSNSLTQLTNSDANTPSHDH
jgi:hypothetical protein